MTATVPSLAKLKPNPAWAKLPLFDRTGWKRMAFGEFAESIGERAEPKDAQEEIYVGLEHLDPQCLHIRRWGKGSDVIGGKLRFRKGDIIFGKRRAYQRKLAVAEFGGICSAHAMVIRARPDKVLPEFLPFLMMSDRFMNRAVEISVGSLSPTINWTTLKLETFDLPPLDQQRRIAEILWAVDEVMEEYRNAFQSGRLARELESKSMFSEEGSSKWPYLKMDEICTVQQGQVDPKEAPYSQMIHIAPDDIESETGRILETKTAAEDKVISGKYEFTDEAILYCKIRPYLRKVAFPRFSGICSADMYPVYAKTNILPEFLFQLLLSDHFTKYAIMHSARSAFPKLNREALFAFQFRLPPLAAQKQFLTRLNCIEDSANSLATHVEKLRLVQSAITGSIFP